MGRRPIGRKAMTSAERVRRSRARVRAAKLKQAAARMDAAARSVIAAALAGGDLHAVPPDTQQRYLADAEAVLESLRAAGLSLIRTSKLK